MPLDQVAPDRRQTVQRSRRRVQSTPTHIGASRTVVVRELVGPVTSSSSPRYAASVANPSGGNSAYFTGRNSGLVASVSARQHHLDLHPADANHVMLKCNCVLLNERSTRPFAI